MNDFTKKVRTVVLILFALVVLGALGGWMLGRDPAQLAGLLTILTFALGIGEASNVGKRLTTKPELHPAGQ